MKEDRFYVYALLDPQSDRVFYIGKGSGRRCERHLTETITQTDNRRKWRRIERIRMSGMEPTSVKIQENMTEESALLLERELIARYGRIGFEEDGILTNLTEGGDGVSGYVHTEETRKLLSELVSGEKHPNFGKNLSEETRTKISEAQKGKIVIVSEETKKKISATFRDPQWQSKHQEARKRSIAALTAEKTVEQKALIAEKVSQKLKGRTVPPEQELKRKLNQPPMTEDIKNKISAAKRGKPWSAARRAAQERKHD